MLAGSKSHIGGSETMVMAIGSCIVVNSAWTLSGVCELDFPELSGDDEVKGWFA